MARRRLARYARLAGLAIAVIAVAGIVAWGFADGNATVVTAATALIVLVVGEYRRGQVAAQQDRWDRIAGEYEKFFALIRRRVNDGNDGSDSRAVPTKKSGGGVSRSSVDVEREMATFADKLMLWGSPRVIKAWVQMRRNAADGQPALDTTMDNFGRMILAIRREFGHSDVRLEERDLLRVMFNEEIEVMVARANLRDGREILRALAAGDDGSIRLDSPMLSTNLNMPLNQVDHLLAWFENENPPFVRRIEGGDGANEQWEILPAGRVALGQLEEKDLDGE